jgi:hypothetical protein
VEAVDQVAMRVLVDQAELVVQEDLAVVAAVVVDKAHDMNLLILKDIHSIQHLVVFQDQVVVAVQDLLLEQVVVATILLVMDLMLLVLVVVQLRVVMHNIIQALVVI